jgi:nucleoside-diphosphate-sugar epimerase
MRALITGGTGFIGYHLIRDLLAKEWQIRCLVRKTSTIPEEFIGKVEFITGDITDKTSLKGIIDNIDLVIHMAGLIKASNFKSFKKVNTEGTVNLINTIPPEKRSSIKFIFISSMAACGPSRNRQPLSEDQPPTPISHYGQSKLLAEQAVRKSSLDYRIIRPAAVYGPGDRETLSFFRLAAKHINPRIGFRKRYLSLIHVKDLISLIFKAALSDKKNQIYNATDCTNGYSWNKIIKKASDNLDSWLVPLYIPKSFVAIAAYSATLWSKISNNSTIFNVDKFNEMKQQYWLLSSAKAQDQLDFSPAYDLQKGFSETAQWYQEKGWI